MTAHCGRPTMIDVGHSAIGTKVKFKRSDVGDITNTYYYNMLLDNIKSSDIITGTLVGNSASCAIVMIDDDVPFGFL